MVKYLTNQGEFGMDKEIKGLIGEIISLVLLLVIVIPICVNASSDYREKKEQIFSSRDIFELMKPCLTDLAVEECWVILLNQASRMIKKVRISIGGLSATAVDVRVILKEAITASASAMALVHNHPSGSVRPSREDDLLTKNLNQAAELMNIRLIDHLIFTDAAYYSYCDEGRL